MTQHYVWSSLEGGMVPTGSPLDPMPGDGSDPEYCGYCHGSPCNCIIPWHGDYDPARACGYCYTMYDAQGNCDCDGFGNRL